VAGSRCYNLFISPWITSSVVGFFLWGGYSAETKRRDISSLRLILWLPSKWHSQKGTRGLSGVARSAKTESELNSRRFVSALRSLHFP